MYHNLFNHSLVKNTLVAKNKASIKKGLRGFSTHLGEWQRLLGHMVGRSFTLAGSEWEFLFSTSSSVFGVSYSGPSNKRIVASHYCFNLQSSNDVWCCLCIHCLTFLYVSKWSVYKGLWSIFNQILYFLLLSFKNSFNILGKTPLSEVSFANIFCGLSSYSWHCLLWSKNF